MEPLLRGNPDERPPSLEKPFDKVDLNTYIYHFKNTVANFGFSPDNMTVCFWYHMMQN